MTNVLFQPPERKTPVAEEIEATPIETVEEPQPVSEPLPYSDASESLLNDFDQPTDVPTDHFAADSDPEPFEEEDEDEDEPIEVEEDENVGLDAESLEIISEAVTQSNNEGARMLINWLNGPDAEKFPGATPEKLSTLQKAWKGILLRIKYKPSGWDALWAAQWNAFGWHLAAALISFVTRWFKGLVRWPWQAAKKVHRAVTQEREETPAPEPQSVPKTSSSVVENSRAPETDSDSDSEENSSSEPLKICLQTNKPFKGDGYPKTSKKHPELIGKFIDSGAFRAYCNRMGLSGPNAKTKKEK